MRFRVTPLDITLCVDSMLISVPLLLVGLEKVHPDTKANIPWALHGGAALAFGFLALRSKSHKSDPRPASSNPVRRIVGVVLMGAGGTLAVLGFIVAYAMLLDLKRISDAVWLAVPAVPILLGSAVIYAGAAIRAPSDSQSGRDAPA